jgi:hypothetical protein
LGSPEEAEDFGAAQWMMRIEPSISSTSAVQLSTQSPQFR